MKRHELSLLAGLLLTGYAAAQPVPLPNPGIPGYQFPEPESTLMQWINQPSAAHARNIHRHGWGLWAALTTPSGQTEYGLANAPVYLTWLTPDEVAALPADAAANATSAVAAAPRQMRLRVPRQFMRIPGFMEKLQARLAALSQSQDQSARGVRDTSSFEMVGYDPSAAAFASKNQLFSKTALTKLYQAGNASIPAFPSTAVTVKPVYKLVSKANMIPGTSLYVMPAWPGTPKPTPAMQGGGFPEEAWPGCVYIDAKNPGRSTAQSADASCSSPSAANTFGLGDFIRIPVTAANAALFSSLAQKQLKQPVEPGDTLILMAMHVTSREMTEWTWQTFFWTPAPAKPPLPSSVAVAQARPAQLPWPAAHYAMSIGYQMVAPNQPVNGGKSVGSPVTVYNPYLEAGFDSSVFQPPPPLNVGIYNPKTKATFRGTLGIQSNCMTCHSGASVKMDSAVKRIGYATNFYIPRNAPMFKGNLQTDFLWSIADGVE